MRSVIMESTIRRRSFLEGALAVPGAVGANAIGAEAQASQGPESGIGRVRFGMIGIGMRFYEQTHGTRSHRATRKDGRKLSLPARFVSSPSG